MLFVECVPGKVVILKGREREKFVITRVSQNPPPPVAYVDKIFEKAGEQTITGIAGTVEPQELTETGEKSWTQRELGNMRRRI